MKLSELKKIIDTELSRGASGDEEVVVSVFDSAVCAGARASSKIKTVYKGFDLENHQFRIITEDTLRKEGRTLENPDRMIVFKYIYDTRCSYSYRCPNCSAKIPKESKFCLGCGKKVFFDGHIDFVKNYR